MPSTKKLLQAAAGSAGSDPLYVEDVFSTYLYDGNGSTNVIANGIDLAGEGGLVWGKSRDNAFGHMLIDTVRGGYKGLSSNGTSAEYDNSAMISSFNSNGFTVGSYAGLNYNGDDVASWTFRKAEKFFDVVTYTGNGASSRTIAHSLGSVPGMMTVKGTSNVSGWRTYHTNLGPTKYVQLQSTAADATYNVWNDTTPTDSVFSISTDINANGVTYVAYLFASDAGGFGDDEDENIIKCGAFSSGGNYDAIDVALGFEPQWILIKPLASSDWNIMDTARLMTVDRQDLSLAPNTSAAETALNRTGLTATGFTYTPGFTNTAFIYMAIRRGPMKIPEDATKVFGLATYDGTPGIKTNTFVDFGMLKQPAGTSGPWMTTRLTGTKFMYSYSTAAEGTESQSVFDRMDGLWSGNLTSYIGWGFSRAPGFMDVVAYSGTGTNPLVVNHNLAVAPELMITKRRNGAVSWLVGVPSISLGAFLNTADAFSSSRWTTDWANFSPTSTIFKVSDGTAGSGDNMIAYLFATLAGVSKVGTYTANANSTNIACGFSGTARFILIKRTDSSGDWYVWDSVRGITAAGSNDPYMLMNTNSADVTNTDYIATYAGGFNLTTSGSSTINVSGGSYIFLAIA